MNSYIRLACLSSLSLHPFFHLVQSFSIIVVLYSCTVLYTVFIHTTTVLRVLYVQCTLLVPSTLEEEKYSTVLYNK